MKSVTKATIFIFFLSTLSLSIHAKNICFSIFGPYTPNELLSEANLLKRQRQFDRVSNLDSKSRSAEIQKVLQVEGDTVVTDKQVAKVLKAYNEFTIHPENILLDDLIAQNRLLSQANLAPIQSRRLYRSGLLFKPQKAADSVKDLAEKEEMMSLIIKELGDNPHGLKPEDIYTDLILQKKNTPPQFFFVEKSISKLVTKKTKSLKKSSPLITEKNVIGSIQDEIKSKKLKLKTHKQARESLNESRVRFKEDHKYLPNSIESARPGTYEIFSEIRQRYTKILGNRLQDLKSRTLQIGDLKELLRIKESASQEYRLLAQTYPKESRAYKFFNETADQMSITHLKAKYHNFQKKFAAMGEVPYKDLASGYKERISSIYRDIGGNLGEKEVSLLLPSNSKSGAMVSELFPQEWSRIRKNVKDREIDYISRGSKRNYYLWSEVKTLEAPLSMKKHRIPYTKIQEQAIEQHKIISDLGLNNPQSYHYVESQRILLPGGITQSTYNELKIQFQRQTGRNLEIIGPIYPD